MTSTKKEVSICIQCNRVFHSNKWLRLKPTRLNAVKKIFNMYETICKDCSAQNYEETLMEKVGVD